MTTFYDGKPCSMWVNKSECEYCEYHAASALRKLDRAPQAKRAAPSSTVAFAPTNISSMATTAAGRQHRRAHPDENTLRATAAADDNG